MTPHSNKLMKMLANYYNTRNSNEYSNLDATWAEKSRYEEQIGL